VEPSIQAHWKFGVFLGEVDEVGGPTHRNFMPALLEALSGSRFGVFLAGKNEYHIATLIAQWHPIGKRALPDCPTHVYAQGLINPSS
jgi:hypothetical protein